MANYAPSTRARIADLIEGMHVETSVGANTTYLIQTQQEIFNIYGMLRIHMLFMEIITDMSATATTIKFNATFTTPTIAASDLTGASASMSGKARGVKAYSVGGAVATAAVLTAAPGISDIDIAPQIVGGTGFVGTIGQLTAGADATSGTSKFHLFYTPMSDGAYAEAVY